MKTVEIQAKEFFDMLKIHDISMWNIFGQMIDGENKKLLFFNEEKQLISEYTLPGTKEELEEDYQSVKDFMKEIRVKSQKES